MLLLGFFGGLLLFPIFPKGYVSSEMRCNFAIPLVSNMISSRTVLKSFFLASGQKYRYVKWTVKNSERYKTAFYRICFNLDFATEAVWID